MPGCKDEGRSQQARVQPGVVFRTAAPCSTAFRAVALCCALGGCSDPLGGPIDLFHNLEGGTIAAQRPPPPGVGQPYPKLGTVPPKPAVADIGYRRSLQAQLAAERDRTQRTAADTPIEHVPPPPGLPPAPPPNAPPVANATLETAEAPPTPEQPPPASPQPAQPNATVPVLADIGPPPGTLLTLAGAPADMSGLPPIPDAPPPPATFEGVPAEPAPTQRVVSIQQPPPPGTRVFFGADSTVLSQSQAQAVRDFGKSAGGRSIEIIGLGDAADDSPGGQTTAIALALSRARAVAEVLAAQHVPAGTIRIGANAFGRGAVLRFI